MGSAILNDATGLKPKGHSAVNVNGMQKESQSSLTRTIGTCNVKTLSQGKLKIIKGQKESLIITIQTPRCKQKRGKT